MKARTKLILILLVVAGLAAGVLSVNTGFWFTPFRGVKYPEFSEIPDFQKVLTPGEMKEDLAQLQEDLAKVHPLTQKGMPEWLKAAFAEADRKTDGEMTVGEFSIIAASLTCRLEDAHTSVALIGNDRPLPMTVKIINGRFYALDGLGFEPGDEILSIGGLGVEALLEFAGKVISAENDQWRERRLERTLRQSFLSQAGAKIDGKRNIVLEVCRNGKRTSIPTSFGYTKPEQAEGPVYSYYLDKEARTCVFSLRSCDYTDDYIQFISNMFQDIHSEGIENIIVDLRGNAGGHSQVVNEFLRYFDIAEYKNYGCNRRMSKAAAAQRGYIIKWGSCSHDPRIVKNDVVDGPLFSGKVFALIDNGTFSSGNFFAIILADNGIGETIGQPSGNAPCSYGDVLFFQLKHSKLFYNMSYTRWVRPRGESNENALFPDHFVERTIDDYVNQRDPEMEKAMRLIRLKAPN